MRYFMHPPADSLIPMDAEGLLKKIRKIEIKTKGLSQNIFAGEYHSAFRRRGMTFSEVREYQYGDDIRDIDWNVTARHNRLCQGLRREGAR